MTQNKDHLIWIDMEMTGLNPDADRIIEVAIVVTDSNLERIDEGAVWVINQDRLILEAMDEWNTSTHTRSGLVDRVLESRQREVDVESAALEYVSKFLSPKTSPMCGNSICQDRRFMARWMPRLEAFFHYRNLDVSTLKELAKRWKPEVLKGVVKHGKHEALADVYESIEELKHYRKEFIIQPS